MSWRSVIVCQLTATSNEPNCGELPTTFMVWWADERLHLAVGNEISLHHGHAPVTGVLIDPIERVEHADVVATVPAKEFDAQVYAMQQRQWTRVNSYRDAHGWYTRPGFGHPRLLG